MCDGCPPGKSQLVDDRIQGLLRCVGITAMFPGLVASLAATLNAPDEKSNPSSMLVSRVLASDRREPVGYKHAAPPHSASASDRWPWTMITKYKSSAFVSRLPRTCGRRRWRQVSRRSTPRTRRRTVARMSRALGRARSPRSPGWRISKRCARLDGPKPVAANRSRGTGRDCRCPRPGHAHPQCGCTRYSCCAQGVRAEPPHTVTTVVRMQTTHRESPATQVARRQALAFATRRSA
jgi:hypothetical protein